EIPAGAVRGGVRGMVREGAAILAAGRKGEVGEGVGLPESAAEGAQPDGGLGRSGPGAGRIRPAAGGAVAIRSGAGGGRGAVPCGEGMEASVAARELHRGFPKTPAGNRALGFRGHDTQSSVPSVPFWVSWHGVAYRVPETLRRSASPAG